MSLIKIQDARYKKNNITERVSAQNLSRKDYLNKYRGYLYCIEPDCNALLSFVEWKKHNIKFFRTWSKSKHKTGCPSEVLYDDESRNKLYTDNEEFVNLTDKHINDKLKRAFEAITTPKRQKSFLDKFIKQENTKNPLTSNLIYPALFEEGEDSLTARQPYILTRQFDKLDEDDIDKVRCVIGTVKSIYLFETHGYINLTYKGPDSVKICFSPAFVNNEKNISQYPKFEIFNTYFTTQKEKGITVVCCCIGRLNYAKNGINIYPDRYNGFTLNGLGYYDLIRKYYTPKHERQ